MRPDAKSFGPPIIGSRNPVFWGPRRREPAEPAPPQGQALVLVIAGVLPDESFTPSHAINGTYHMGASQDYPLNTGFFVKFFPDPLGPGEITPGGIHIALFVSDPPGDSTIEAYFRFPLFDGDPPFPGGPDLTYFANGPDWESPASDQPIANGAIGPASSDQYQSFTGTATWTYES